MHVREGTADHNNVVSCMDEDEYALRDISLGAGVAVDVGAHIGGVTLALALDNPDARVIAVEPLSANVEVLRQNLADNDVTNVTVLHAAATEPGKKKATVRWNFGPDEASQHHRFIGNAQVISVGKGEEETVDAVDLPGLLKLAGGHIDFMKLDCEGGEYALFAKGASGVGEIRGEYHDGWQALSDLLEPTHVLTRTGTDHFGGFRAVPR